MNLATHVLLTYYIILLLLVKHLFGIEMITSLLPVMSFEVSDFNHKYYLLTEILVGFNLWWYDSQSNQSQYSTVHFNF